MRPLKDLFLKMIRPKAYDLGLELIEEVRSSHADAAKVKDLIDRGAPLRLTDPKSGADAPMLAVQNGRADLLQLMIDTGIDLNYRYTAVNVVFGNVNSETLLDWSIASPERHDCARLLIESGADVNQPRRNNYTFLMESAYRASFSKGSLDLAKLLVDRGATVWERDSDGCTALHYAARGGVAELLTALLDKDAELIDMADKNGDTPLMHLFKHPYLADSDYAPHHELEKDLVKVAQILIARGADLTRCNKAGKTALDLAKANNHAEIALLIENAVKAQQPGKNKPSGPKI